MKVEYETYLNKHKEHKEHKEGYWSKTENHLNKHKEHKEGYWSKRKNMKKDTEAKKTNKQNETLKKR